MKIACVDFDGTIVTHEYPEIGEEVPMAISVLRELMRSGTKIILWTMRSEKPLDEAVEFLEERDVELWGVNKNPTQKVWTQSPKAYGQMYIDDAALGCPLIESSIFNRPFVDWLRVREILVDREFIC